VVDPVEGKVNAQGRPYAFATRFDEQGQPVMEEERRMVQRLCKAHRIRYSKQFFPVSTAALRCQLFGEKQETQEDGKQHEVSTGEEAGQERAEAENQEQQRSVWILHEVEPLAIEGKDGRRKEHGMLLRKKLKGEVEGDEVGVDVEEVESEELEPDSEEALDVSEHALRVQRYQRMHREALLESLQALREGRWLYSRRIIGIWNYQREQLRLAG
jgi:hypothetical protein